MLLNALNFDVPGAGYVYLEVECPSPDSQFTAFGLLTTRGYLYFKKPSGFKWGFEGSPKAVHC